MIATRRFARFCSGLALVCVVLSFLFAGAGDVLATLGALLVAACLSGVAWLNFRRDRMGVRDTGLGAAIGRYLSTSRDLSPSERIVLIAGIAFPSIAVVALAIVTCILAAHPLEAASAASAALSALSIALTCFVRLRLDSKRSSTMGPTAFTSIGKGL